MANLLETWRNRSVKSELSMDNISMAASDVPSDVVVRQNIQYGSTLQAAWAIFAEYCSNSTIHGIRYLGQRRRPKAERLFWIAMFIFSIYACVQSIANIYIKWNDTPVIVSFARKTTPIWEIPFPSVTLCPLTKALGSVFNFTNTFYELKKSVNSRSSKKFRVTEKPSNLTMEEFEQFQALLHVCDPEVLDRLDLSVDDHPDIPNILYNLSLDFNSSAPFFKLKNVQQLSEDVFTKVLTNEGICVNINNIAEDEILRFKVLHNQERVRPSSWSLEKGYHPDSGVDAYPERVLGAGAKAGLFMAMFGLATELDTICEGVVQGFKIFLTSPDESPQAVTHSFTISYNQEVLLSVIPHMISTSESLRDYSPSRRQCFFEGERYLRYFKIYTQNNCNFECLINATIKKCGCIKFSMPRVGDIPYCSVKQMECYKTAENDILRAEYEEGLATATKYTRGESVCHCLPACNSLTYDVEISRSDFDVPSLLNSMGEKWDEEAEDDINSKIVLSRLSVFFKQKQFIKIVRSELYGTTDFLANCGGLLGLFMGVSTLSLIEIIYFFTVRLFSNIKMRRKRKKQQEKLAELGIPARPAHVKTLQSLYQEKPASGDLLY